MLAVSIGDQAGNRCCLKAELSGLRAKGPGLPFTFPMRARALASEELDWQLETQKLRVNQPSSCLPVFYFSDISLHTHTHTPLCLPRDFPSRLCIVGATVVSCYLLTAILYSTTSFCYFQFTTRLCTSVLQHTDLYRTAFYIVTGCGRYRGGSGPLSICRMLNGAPRWFK